MGALVTDSPELHTRTVAELTANLCSNALGQQVFGALAHLDHDELHGWYADQRAYYAPMLTALASGFETALPGIIVSLPQASLYTVVDLRRIAPHGFDAAAFVKWCASTGRVTLDGADYTLLAAPMRGFYAGSGADTPGTTQLRLAMVESTEKMALVPQVFASLLRTYIGQVEAD